MNIHIRSKYKVISGSPKNAFPNKKTIPSAKQKTCLEAHKMAQQDTSKTHFKTHTKFVHRPTPNTAPDTQETPIPTTPKNQIRQYYSFIFWDEKKMDILATAQKTGFWLHFWHPRRRSRSQGCKEKKTWQNTTAKPKPEALHQHKKERRNKPLNTSRTTTIQSALRHVQKRKLTTSQGSIQAIRPTFRHKVPLKGHGRCSGLQGREVRVFTGSMYSAPYRRIKTQYNSNRKGQKPCPDTSKGIISSFKRKPTVSVQGYEQGHK